MFSLHGLAIVLRRKQPPRTPTVYQQAVKTGRRELQASYDRMLCRAKPRRAWVWLQVLSSHTENAGWGHMFILEFKPGGLVPGKVVPRAALLPEPSTTSLLV